jgi:phenylpropionate dioxygenase-like ring-hydroxylating dioxygenase large terminal subunit
MGLPLGQRAVADRSSLALGGRRPVPVGAVRHRGARGGSPAGIHRRRQLEDRHRELQRVSSLSDRSPGTVKARSDFQARRGGGPTRTRGKRAGEGPHEFHGDRPFEAPRVDWHQPRGFEQVLRYDAPSQSHGNFNSDVVHTFLLEPSGPTHTHITSHYLFRPETVAQSDFDPSEFVEFRNTVSMQDWAACENAQRRVRSRGYANGGFLPYGDRFVRDFNLRYRRMLDAPGA